MHHCVPLLGTESQWQNGWSQKGSLVVTWSNISAQALLEPVAWDYLEKFWMSPMKEKRRMIFLWFSYGSSHISICSHCPCPVTEHHWEEPVSVFVPCPHGFTYIRKVTPSLHQAKQSHLSQPFLTGKWLQSFHDICGHLLDSFQYVCVCLSYQGVQNWKQNPMCDLTSAEERA